MIKLPISILSVITSNDYYDKTIRSLEKTLESVYPEFGVSIICPQKPEWSTSNIRHIQQVISCDYSYWLLKNLPKYSGDEHVLIHQWDSCVIDTNYWTNEYLEYDYIGAIIPIKDGNTVGNGGFSLRSKKFLTACNKIAEGLPRGEFIIGNEDYYACVSAYNYMTKNQGIRFAPESLARKFSVERPIWGMLHEYTKLETYKSFGFHGAFNVAGMNIINS